MVTTAIACGIGIFALSYSTYLIQVFGKTSYLLFMAGCAGSLGALLSIIFRLGTLSCDTTAEKKLHYVEGMMRIIAGVISGILIGALVKLGIFLPVFSQTGMIATAMCSAAILAGASERLVPGLIAKVESTDHLFNGDKK